MREIFDLGEKVDNFIYPAEFCQPDFRRPSPGSVSLTQNNLLQPDFTLTYNSLTHSEIRNCNNRIEKGGLGNMSIDLRNSMNRI